MDPTQPSTGPGDAARVDKADAQSRLGRIAVTGSSGLIGMAMASALARDGCEVIHLVRHDPDPKLHEARWAPQTGQIDADTLEGVDAVVHLSGRNIASGRWTAANRRAIWDSRVPATERFCQSLAQLQRPPKVLVSASAIGFYGDRGDEWLDETSEPGEGFLASLVLRWEKATQPAIDAGIRVVNPRLSTVLSPLGGALAKLLLPFRLGLGGPIGDGRQWWSWVSIDDVVGAIRHLLGEPALRGPVNVASPNPVTNRQFARALGSVLGRPAAVPFPRLAVKIAFGQMGDEVLLASARAKPDRLIQSGYRFQHPTLEAALADLLKRP